MCENSKSDSSNCNTQFSDTVTNDQSKWVQLDFFDKLTPANDNALCEKAKYKGE